MMRNVVVVVSLVGASMLGQHALLAQGKGNGLHRGLSAAAKGTASSGVSRAVGHDTGASKGIIRSGSSLGRAGQGLQRSSAAMTPTPATSPETGGDDQANGNPQRILDQRLNQAEHLREIAARNGNDHLLNTADRMASNATTNFDRQQQRLTGVPIAPTTPPATDPTTPTAPDTATGSGSTAGTVSTTVTPQTQTRHGRGFWLRSR
jgi:hypothetical protein